MPADSQTFDFEAFLREEVKSGEHEIERCDDALQDRGSTPLPPAMAEDVVPGQPSQQEEIDRMFANWRRKDFELLLEGADGAFARPRESKFDVALGRALIAAIEKQNLSVVRFLLCQQGVAPRWFSANAALVNRDTTILQLLLDHGWDINEQQSWCEPPLLGRVCNQWNEGRRPLMHDT